MARRLASFFTIMAFVLFSATWLVRRMLSLPVMDITQLFMESWLVIGVYMAVGLFLARLGIALVMEVLEERRRKEDERRERARSRYIEVISGEDELAEKAEA